MNRVWGIVRPPAKTNRDLIAWRDTREEAEELLAEVGRAFTQARVVELDEDGIWARQVGIRLTAPLPLVEPADG